MTATLRIDLSGTPQEIGLQHGKLLATQIRSQISVYEAMFKTTSNMDWQTVREVAGEYATTLKRLTPDLYLEMEGIAQGAGLDVLDIVALNCKSEIGLGLFSDGCSSLAWQKGNDGVFLAQNWDWTARVKDNLVIMSIDQPGKPKVWMVNEAGLVGKIGFNSSSVGICINAIRAKPADSSKVPFHVAMRVCLESETAAAAMKQLQELGSIGSSQHILLADITGAVSMELSPLGDIYLQPNEDGFICHTNHLIENRYVEERPWLSGSPVRLERMKSLATNLSKSHVELDAKVLREQVFSDTYNTPQSICCHEDMARPIETRPSTLFCIVMKFIAGQQPKAEVVMGMPGTAGEGPVIRLG